MKYKTNKMKQSMQKKYKKYNNHQHDANIETIDEFKIKLYILH